MTDEDEAAERAQKYVRRAWRTLPELVGIQGAAEILGVDKSAIHRWLEPGSGSRGPDRTYMIPPRRVEPTREQKAKGKKGWPVWPKSDVERFKVEHGRLRAPEGQPVWQERRRKKG